jgi:hypothetical protein
MAFPPQGFFRPRPTRRLRAKKDDEVFNKEKCNRLKGGAFEKVYDIALSNGNGKSVEDHKNDVEFLRKTARYLDRLADNREDLIQILNDL